MEFQPMSSLSRAQHSAVREIYEGAFPAWQREPFSDIMGRDGDPHRLHLALMEGEAPLGLAVLSRFRGISWWFLEYFAVRADRRDAGLGGALWDAVRSEIEHRHDVPRVVMEVERPEKAAIGSSERDERERRIRFYERRGARGLPLLDYTVPRLDGSGVEELLVLVVPAAGEPMPSGPDLSVLVRALYTEGYGLSNDDPLMASALGSVEADAP